MDLQGGLMMFNTYFKQEVTWCLVFKEKTNYPFFHQTIYKPTGNKHQSLPQTTKIYNDAFENLFLNDLRKIIIYSQIIRVN